MKNGLNNINYKKVLFHTLGWLILFLTIFIPIQIYNTFDFTVRLTFGVVFPLILPVYIHFYLVDNYFDKKKYWIYGIWALILVLASSFFAQWFVEFMWSPEGENINAFLDPLVVIIVTTGVKYYYKGIKLQLQLHEAKAKQYKAELDLLKFQVNPHFFFNTLNNLFSMARKHEDQSTAKGIAKLSHLMRYMIYDCNTDKIELEKEIEQIRNFIELQKLRFSKDDTVKINFNISGNTSQVRITPMLLIPFVENAFKHGVSLKKYSPIDINLFVENSTLLFSVKNNINKLIKGRDDRTSGIGLNNVKKRLQLLYPHKHTLSISDTNDEFEVKLQIKFSS
jgi:hypothetical protein